MSYGFTLVRHPDVLNKLKKEIGKTFAESDSIDRNKLKNMNYLTNILKESKNPIIPLGISLTDLQSFVSTPSPPPPQSPSTKVQHSRQQFSQQEAGPLGLCQC